jgi:hypothetical protein
MAIDSRYVAAADLQEYLVDKSGSGALAGGLVYFYQDNSRTTLQSVYELTGNAPNYSFSPLPNPVVLSSVGTFMDNNGNDIVPYYLPWLIVNGEITNTQSLYYVVVQNAEFIPQFTREAWPPNSYTTSGSTPIGAQGDLNYIPNGQFLAHNNLPEAGLITQASTILAPGGVVFNIKNALSSTNFVTFNYVGTWTADPPQSPEYEMNIVCTVPNTSEVYKSLSITFNDVNKFANGDAYTFGFWGIANAGSVNITVNVNKYFGVGGASFTPVEQNIVTLTAAGQFFSIPINFGENAGDAIGTGQTTVSIDLSFDTALAFNISVTDFVLVVGSTVLGDFPAQTNADMLTRSVAGWMNVPDYNGMDLYLPPVLTAYGMQWDHSIIGKVEASVGAITSPNSTSPLPLGNDMPCDGTPYIYANYSALGIPYSRLGAYLIANSPIPNTPMYGTGTDFATAYAYHGDTTSFRLTINNAGTGVAAANDVDSGLTFSVIPVYNGSSTGGAATGYIAYTNAANTVLAVAASAPISPAADVNTGFTIASVGGDFSPTGLLAFQEYAFTVQCLAASSLATGAAGKYFQFYTGIPYFVWFKITTETQPGGTGTPIQINLQSTDTAQDVANILRETLNSYQSTLIKATTAPVEGTYWEFQTNPPSTDNFLVWYTYITTSSPPIIAGRVPIKVLLPASPTSAQVVTLTLTAINAYQYASPNFAGMFLRGTDFSALWDTDVAQRWSLVSGLSGANYGTFEFSQFEHHTHQYTQLVATGSIAGGGSSYQAVNNPTGFSGGNETRPVNAYIQWVIKY